MGATFNLKGGFNQLKKKKAESALVLLRYSYRRHVFTYSTNIRINLKYWDNKKKTVKITHDYPQSKIIRQKLDLLSNKVEQFAFEIEFEKGSVDYKELRARMNELFRPESEKEEKSEKVELMQYLDQYIERKKSRLSGGKKPKTNYERLRTNLVEFQKYRRRAIEFDSVKSSFIESFKKFCFNRKGLSINYTSKLIKTLRSIMKEAKADGLHENSYYESSSFNVRSKQTESIFVSLDELDLMYNANIGEERLDNVRKLFIVACFSGGVRYGDMTQISKESVELIDQQKYFSFITEKTNQRVRIPLHPYVEKIYDEWDWQPPMISNQKMNEYLKEVGKAVGLVKPTALLKSEAGKMKSVTKPKYEWLSTKIARKSFATNCYLSGWPIRLIMSITGHTTEKMLMVYIAAKSLEYAKMINEGEHLAKMRFNVADANINLK